MIYSTPEIKLETIKTVKDRLERALKLLQAPSGAKIQGIEVPGDPNEIISSHRAEDALDLLEKCAEALKTDLGITPNETVEAPDNVNIRHG